MDSKIIKYKSTKLVRGVCRLCGDDFSSLKDRCELLPSGAATKPPFTRALEDITGPVCAEDGLTAVCVRCKQHLTRYHRHKADVERRGTAIKDLAAKSVFTRRKRFAPAEESAAAAKRTQRKRAKLTNTAAAAAPRRGGSGSATPGAPTSLKSLSIDTVDGTKATVSTPKKLPVLWSMSDVKAAVGKVSQKDADGVAMATSATVSQLTPPTETSISSPSIQSAQAAGGKVSEKDADAVATATSTPAPQASPLTAHPETSISSQSVQDTVDRTKATVSTPKKLPVLWSLSDVKAAVGKMSQKDADGVSMATSTTASQASPATASPSTHSGVQEDDSAARELSVRPPPKTYDIGPGQRSIARIIVTTRKWRHSRIITGPLERVADALVRAEHYRLPRCLMKIPGMDHIMIDEVLKRVREEAIKLTSVRFGSVLRQTTQEALDKFDWADVVSEWREHAPTFLKFLECASSASFDAPPAPDSSYTKTKKGATVMAGATLLRARVHQMNAMQHHNSLLLRQGGANKRCLARLSRLGCCVYSKRQMAIKKSEIIRNPPINHMGEGQDAEGMLHVQSLTGEQDHSAAGPQQVVQELPPTGATSLEALLGLEVAGGDQEHAGPQHVVQELSASEVTSLEALLGLEEGGVDQEHSATGPQPGVQELPPSGATSLEALLGLEVAGGDETPMPSAGDRQEQRNTRTDSEDPGC